MITNHVTSQEPSKPEERLEAVTIRFCGDSGDGMQLAGTQFSNVSALFGNDISTLPDFPAEIRAPAGTLAGVSGYQVHFSSTDIYTPGDLVDVLVAMNPAALKSNLADLVQGGQLIVNQDEFKAGNLKKAGYDTSPLEDDSLAAYQVHKVPITTLNKEALAEFEIGSKAVDRCKNFFALGLVYWLYGRPMQPTLDWIEAKFRKLPEIAAANVKALKSGYFYGETTETFVSRYYVPEARIEPGRYRKVTGYEALALGFVAAARLSGKPLFLGSYPITPASTFLEEMNSYKHLGVKTLQAEDEIAAVTSAIGAAYAGSLALTSTSGPGLALKSEAISLAVTMELPLVIIDVQRGGPSTGLPTKTEQADLLFAMWGRHGECPLPIIAASTPGHCFEVAIQAARIAMTYMTPVILLTDGYLANGAEPWKVPQFDRLQRFEVHHPTASNSGNGFLPYKRDAHLARPWALPGTPGLQHRLGGLEKEDVTGNVCYDPANHQRMTNLRAQKVANVAELIPPTQILGEREGELLIVGWGSTFGHIRTAARLCQQKGLSVSAINLTYLNPLPPDLGDILNSFEQVLVPELNMGQLSLLLRARYLVDVQSLCKVQGKPFLVSEITSKVHQMIGEKAKV